MGQVAILTCILGNFDTPVDPPTQSLDVGFHRFTDEDFPPIAGLTPRLQYRIPKTHGWQMRPGYDAYIWLDGSFSLAKPDSAEWFLDQLGDNDIALFKHPWRNNMREETEHIDEHLKANKPYITPRYKNGLHKEQLSACITDPDFIDDRLFASTVFIYRNNPKVQEMLKEWLYTSVRYFTCDQIVLPYLVWKYDLKVTTIEENQYKHQYIKEVSKHA